ncbi:MAG: tetratricopeptide repeat protein [Serratia liquefaciens]|jgi:tetratricopeptide (TPR) repeat protein|nr:tetratricopeptide repeat protein [Serratia liquefaciens]MCH4232294.1 tetratricopeptide repeat protein [Serratia liquefaciens]MCH4263909.1 tetratricopeptide repeat protein [Serratia liquefaciens]MCI1216427.1 tetratricopeptide repeat protein [Serratia liquefaciens]MCI1237244.1 tetratricopeptide repeat protein [Serratia liquefaciens]
MKAWVPLLLAYGALACDQAMAQIDEPDIDADCHKVASYAELGKNAYQRGDYPRAADIFRDQAAWSEFCGLDSQATATAYNNVALALIHAGKLLKARAYLELAPQDSKSQHNLKLLQERLAKRTPSIGPGGVYWQYAGRGVWSEVEVKPQDGRWLIVYSGYYMPQMGLYYGPNMGEFTQTLPIEHGKAVYRQREPEDVMACDVAMQFGSDGLDMHTEGDCGFGFNVRAEGHFIRVE